jgi:hypothetical protein
MPYRLPIKRPFALDHSSRKKSAVFLNIDADDRNRESLRDVN